MKSALTTKSRDEDRLRAAGRRIMRRSSVAICGLARDCAGKLDVMIPQLERLGSDFAASRFVAVENDSRDNTDVVLSSWRKANRSVRLIQFCYRAQAPARQPPRTSARRRWFGPERMQRMVFARNLYLEALSEEPLPDFVIVIDLDIRSFSLEGVAHSFGLLDDWDVVTANGTRYSIRNPFRTSVYWDSYAYEPCGGFPGGVQTPKQIRMDQARIAELLKGGSLLRAWSAFGGLAIYRAGLLRDHRYSVIGNDDPRVPVLCDHPTLHRAIRRQHQDLRLMINPRMRVSYGTAVQLAAQTLGRLSGKFGR
jgi:hypothetical protein